MTYTETLNYIHAVQWAGHKPGLSRTQTLLAALGNPEQGLKFVHIAGTNGKGSTAAMMASCLEAAGYKTGLYTSPYLERFNERMQVNGQCIPDDTLIRLVETVRPFAEAMADKPTEFELITALGMLYFAEEGCDIVVLEVGLGGTLDSTNVIPTPEVAVITALGRDHMAELGDTLAAIASAKAGIIKNGSDVVFYGGAAEAADVIAAHCLAAHATLHTVGQEHLHLHAQTLEGSTFDFDGITALHLPLLGTYQPMNAATALTALRVLAGKGWQISTDDMRTGLASVQWQGRFELLRTAPPFVLDGSHNAHGMRATVKSLQKQFPARKFTFIISVMADKERGELLDLLCPLAKRVITVTANTPRALPAQTLADEFTARGVCAIAAPSIAEGVALADRLSKNGTICALGTLYFSADIRAALSALADINGEN